MEYKAFLAARSMAQITAVQDTLALALVLGLSTAHPLAGATAGLLWVLISRSTSATNIYSLNALQKSGLGGEIIQEKFFGTVEILWIWMSIHFPMHSEK